MCNKPLILLGQSGRSSAKERGMGREYIYLEFFLKSFDGVPHERLTEKFEYRRGVLGNMLQ